MYKIKTTDSFTVNFLDILNFYSKLNVEISREFFTEVSLIEKNIISFPEMYKIRYKNLRRVNLNKFPFCIFYRIESENIIRLIKIVHQSRDPLF